MRIQRRPSSLRWYLVVLFLLLDFGIVFGAGEIKEKDDEAHHQTDQSFHRRRGLKGGSSDGSMSSSGSKNKDTNVFARMRRKPFLRGEVKRTKHRWHKGRWNRWHKAWTDHFKSDTIKTKSVRSRWYAAGTKDSFPLTEITSDGNTYLASANVTLTKSGVVSLAAAKNFVRSVTCHEDATVTIRMIRSVEDSMESLFPIGAILVVSSEVFGPCTLFPSNFVPSSQNPFAGTSDGYLRIQSRSGTPQNAVLNGQAVTFLSLYDTAKVMTRRVNSAEMDDSGNERRLNFIPEIFKEWTLHEPYNDFKFGVSFKGNNRCTVEKLTLDKDEFGWNYGIEAVMDIDVEAEASITMFAGLEWEFPGEENDLFPGENPGEFPLGGVPLYGISLKGLSKLAKMISLDLPEINAGIFLDMSVGFGLEANIGGTIEPTLTVKASTGRKVVSPYVYGSVDVVIWPPDEWKVDAEYGADFYDVSDEITEASFVPDFSPGTLFDEPLKIEASLFLYFKPEIKLAAEPLISFDLPMEIGLKFGAEVGFPLEPVDRDSVLIMDGDCDTCHILGIGVDGVMKSEDLEVTLLEGFDRLEKVKKLNLFAFEITYEIFKGCYIKEFGESTVTCGDTCCNGSQQMCESGSCIDLPDPCDPPCLRTEKCCEGSCVAADDCCPACTGTDVCCGGANCCDLTYQVCDLDTCVDAPDPCFNTEFTGFALNSNPESYPLPQFLEVDPDSPNSLCFLRMTTDTAEPAGTSAFIPVTLLTSELDFSMSSGYRIFGTNDGSADGIAFVMHQDSRGVNAVGGGGAYMGVYEHADAGIEAIKPAIVVEFDTYENTYVDDNGENNIHIRYIDSDGVVTELIESSSINIRTDDSGTPAGRIWVEYCNDIIRVSLNSAGDEKPPDPQLVYKFDLTSLFNGRDVFVGLTASSWDEGDYHDIMSWTFSPWTFCTDQCFPPCTGTDKCCKDSCVAADDCCPACTGTDKCCDGTCKLEECCGSNDPCCGNDDPCCGGDCIRSSSHGDPHLVTFDNLRYDCQGKGEFVLLKSYLSDMQVQGRFEQITRRSVSWTTGVAMSGGTGTPKVQLSFPEGEQILQLLVDGNWVDPSNKYEDSSVRVTSRNNEFEVFYTFSELYVTVSKRGRYIDVTVKLPVTSRNENIRGLFGFPDDDATSDWMTPNGTKLGPPTADLRGQEAYDYCTEQWCIRDASDSLFAYDGEYNFSFYSKCDEDFPGAVDVSKASPELLALCGEKNIACLTDGIEFGIEAARRLLETELAIADSLPFARFSVVPAAVVVNATTNVVLTVNLIDSGAAADEVQEYNVYRVDSATREVDDTPIVVLKDNGLGIGKDTDEGDLVFSYVLPIESKEAGETFSFQAVPVIQGAVDPSSSFVYMALNAVASYSRESGISINHGNSNGVIMVNSIDGLVLVVDYSWPADFADLDTATVFLGSSVGFGCPGDSNSDYLEWYDDDKGKGGTETVKISLGSSFDDAKWTSQVIVDFNAGWYGKTSKGPATIIAYTEKTLSDGTVERNNNAVLLEIKEPGFQKGCASTHVGTANVTVGSDGNVIIDMIPALNVK